MRVLEVQWSRALSLMCEVAQLHIGHRFELVPLIPGGHLLPFSTEFHGKTKHGHGHATWKFDMQSQDGDHS